MKIFILFYLFLCSFELNVSSPITKKDFDAFNEAAAKLESSMKTIVPQVNNYFLKVHHIIKKESVKENKSFTTTKPIEETENFTETGTNLNVKAFWTILDLDKGINDRHNNDTNRTNTNENLIKVYPDSDFRPHMEMAIFNITIKSDGTTEIKRMKMNSAGKPLFNNLSNRQISDIENQTVNSTKKKTYDNDNKDGVSEIEKLDQNSSKVSSQRSQTNKEIFLALDKSTINQNKNDTIGENSENKLLQDEHFNDSESKNSIRKWNIDISNIFSSTTLKTAFYLKENNYVKNKTFNSTKHDPKNNQKNSDLKTETLLTFDLDNQNKLNIMTFEKSKTENHSKILENLENKTTLTSSGTNSSPKENGKSSAKENSEKMKYRQNEQVATETNVIKNSTPITIPNDTKEKSQINNENQSKNESRPTEMVSSTKSAITITEDNQKKDLTSVTEKKIL